MPSVRSQSEEPCFSRDRGSGCASVGSVTPSAQSSHLTGEVCLKPGDKENAMNDLLHHIELAANIAKLVANLLIIWRVSRYLGARKRP